MNDLTITVVAHEGELLGADKVLKLACASLDLLRSIEREMSGKRAALVWTVEIYMLSDRAVIGFSSRGQRGHAAKVAARARRRGLPSD